MTKTHRLREIAVPFDESWDVIVVGGGPAGCAAAAAAAREGARTLLIEASGALGGMGTSAMVPAWTPYSDQEKIIYRGLSEKVFSLCKAGMAHISPKALDWVAIDAERLKRIYDQIVTEEGATVLFHTMLARVERNAEGEVTAILVANKAGLSALRAKVYVDGSGDADLAAWAGAEFHMGDDDGKNLMPATHCFALSNVDEFGYRFGPELHGGNPNSPIYRILRSDKYPEIPDSHLCSNFVGPGTVGFNAGHLFGIDGTDPMSVSRGLIEGRKMAAAYRDALAEFHPRAFGNAFLAATGSALGIRETRRIVGDYILTLDDYMRRRSFADEICRNCYFIDVHWAADKISKDPGQHEKWDTNLIRYKRGESHGIPYRCLTPRGLRNVLVAGRSVSCDQLVQGSVRVMPVCLAMGEAAGIAAAQASSEEIPDVHRVDTRRLRARLLECGAYLGEESPAPSPGPAAALAAVS